MIKIPEFKNEVATIKERMTKNMDKEQINQLIQKLIILRDSADTIETGKYFEVKLTDEQLKIINDKNEELKKDVKEGLIAVGITEAQEALPVDVKPIKQKGV